MRECPVCYTCYPESVDQCPTDGRATFHSLPGGVAIERYVLERRLGEGGMGIVYKAHHQFLKKPLALKIIRRDLVGNDPSFSTRFHQEAMTAAAINHPNIIGVSDFGFLEESIPFIVMEFVEGDSLQDVMNREGPFTPAKALEYMRVIASAVAAAHARGIVHRDLKPLNIMILNSGSSPGEQIRILDFGLAKIKSDLFGSFVGAETTGIIGSPYYMAPEQWNDEEPDKKCDIYSLGIMLHQMLAGDVPFKGSGIPAIMRHHLMTLPPPLANSESGISAQVEEVVHHALEKQRENRTASAEEFIDELEKAVAAEGKPKPKKTRPRKPKTPGQAQRKANDAVGDTSDSLGAGEAVISQPEISAGHISGPEQNTIVNPIALSEIEEEQVPLAPPPEPSTPTVSQSDLLRKATEEARLRAVARAFREIEESGELPPPPVGGSPSSGQRPSPPLPGQVAIGQHSVGILFRNRLVLPIAAGVLVLGLIIVLPLVFWGGGTEQKQGSGPQPTPPPVRAAREMILIQGGEFLMGSNSFGDEQKGEHRVAVASFYLDKYEVTNAEWAEFIKATGRPAPALPSSVTGVTYWKPWDGNVPPAGRERWPVCNVSPNQAQAYAQWLSERDGLQYRLPTEEEWEFAARNGSQGTFFPWGNSWSDGKANINQTMQSPRDIGSLAGGATKDGVMDMIGNVWEWTASKASYYDHTRVKDDAVNARVMRGGSYDEKVNSKLFHNSTSRNWFGDENSRFPTIGFRLARNP
jgi:serine/threonine protein kinase